LLVAGDALTDYEMLVGFPATEVRLVINRNKGGLLAGLYAEALAVDTSASTAAKVRTLLQGRDENRCAFRPSRATVPFGATGPRPPAAPPAAGQSGGAEPPALQAP